VRCVYLEKTGKTYLIDIPYRYRFVTSYYDDELLLSLRVVGGDTDDLELDLDLRHLTLNFSDCDHEFIVFINHLMGTSNYSSA